MISKKKYLVFAHYHTKGQLRKDIVNFLNTSKKTFTKIIFISTKISPNELKKLHKNIKIIRRNNVGYDFYSYKIGINYFIKKFQGNFDNKNLYFTNSSILFIQPNKIIKKITKIRLKNDEFWGISRSLMYTDHIQSYFFFFSAKILEYKEILSWWKTIKPLNNRHKIILKYELGLSKVMLNNNIKINSIYKKNINLKTKNIFKKILQRFNEIFLKTPKYYKKDPTYYFWSDLYRLFGIIKVRLIKNNDKKYNLKKLHTLLKRKKIIIDALNN